MRRKRVGAWLAVLFASGWWSAAMGDDTFRVVAAAFLPTEHVSGEENDYGSGGIVGKTFYHYHVRNSGGVGFEYSRRFHRWFGVTAGVSSTNLIFERYERSWVIDPSSGAIVGDHVVQATDQTRFTPLLVGFDFHMLPEGRCDLFMGPFFGYTWYDTLFGGKVDDHYVSGLSLALDVRVKGRLAFAASVRYIDAEAEPEPKGGPTRLRSNGETSVDPVQISIGVAYRFGGAPVVSAPGP